MHHVVQIASDRYALVCSFIYEIKFLYNLLRLLTPDSFQVLKSERFAKVTSSTQADVEDKSSGGGLSRKKSSARRRTKCSQSESASSNAKNISESSDSENGPGRDAVSASPSASSKTKSVGKSGIGKRNSKRVAERVLVGMQKRQKKPVASDSDSIVSSVVCSKDLQLTSIIAKIMEKQVFYYTNSPISLYWTM